MGKTRLYSLMFSSGANVWRHDVSDALVSIGRSSQASIRIESNGLSRSHAELKYENDKFYIRDLGSLNGTYINGQKMTANEWTEISVDSDLRIGLPPVSVTIYPEGLSQAKTVRESADEKLESSISILQEVNTFDPESFAEKTNSVQVTKSLFTKPSMPGVAVNVTPPIANISELEIKKLQTELDNLKAETTRNSRLNKQFSDLRDKAKIEYEEIQQTVEKLKTQLQQLTSDFEQQKQDCESLTLAKDQIEKALKEHENEKKKLEDSIAELAKAKEVEEEILLKKISAQSDSENKKIEAEKLREASLAQQQACEEQTRILRDEIERQEKHLSDLRSHKSTLEPEIETLRIQLAKIKDEYADQKVLDRKRKADLDAHEAENRVHLLKIEGEKELLISQKKALEHELSIAKDLLERTTADQKEKSRIAEGEMVRLNELKSEQHKVESLKNTLSKNLEEIKTEIRNSQENLAAVKEESLQVQKDIEKAKVHSAKEIETIRHEIISRAHEEKERLLKDVENQIFQKNEQQRVEDTQAKKDYERELAEMKFRASEEIRLMREEEDRRTEIGRTREKEALNQGIEQVVRTNMELMKKAHFSESSIDQMIRETQSAARKIMRIDTESTDHNIMNDNLKSYVPFNPEAKMNEIKFWKKLSYRTGGAIAAIIILFFTPFLSVTKNQVKRILASEQSTADIFAERFREAKKNKPKYDPEQSKDYRTTYTDNVLYLEGYSIVKSEPEIEKAWVLELDSLFKNELNIGDRAVADYIPVEAMLVRELVEIRKTLTPENYETGIAKMRAVEEEKVKKLQEISKGYENYFRIRDLEREFYNRFTNLPSSAE